MPDNCVKNGFKMFISGTLECWSTGVLEYWEMRKNRNRGFQRLRVWQTAIEYYKHTYKIFRDFPFESIERKRDGGEWIDHLSVKETNAVFNPE